MFSRFRLHALISIAILLTATQVYAQAWTEVRSPHFSVVTDAGEKRGREVALRFEQMRYVFGQLFFKDKVSTPAPLQIIGFRNQREFRQFSPLWNGKPIRVDGLYQGGLDRNFILLDLSAEDPYRIVFHEYAHLLLNGNYPPTQLWFDEGFAEYYSTIKVGNRDVQIGLPPDGTPETLRENPLAKSVDLFSIKRDSKVYNEDSDHRSMFYAQSWLIVHYLFDKQKLNEIGNYFNLTENQQAPVAEALQKAFGLEAAQFDRAVQDFYRGNQIRVYTFPLPEMETVNFAFQHLRPTDAQAVLADAHLHSPDYRNRAIAEFQQILAADPKNAAAHRGLGYAYLYKNDFAQAAPHFRQAAQLNANDPRVLYYSALLMNREALAQGIPPANLGEMRADLEQAVKLDPQYAEAYELLAYAQMNQGFTDAALASVRTALQLSPRNEKYMLNYGQYLMVADQWDSAQAIFERLKNSSDEQVRSTAESALQREAQMRENRTNVALANRNPSYTEKQWGVDNSQSAHIAAAISATSNRSADDSAASGIKIDKRPVNFFKGTLLHVQCSSTGSATLSITERNGQRLKLWEMSTPDFHKLVLLGADEFSCDWKNKKVAVNYRKAAQANGDLVSLELR